MGFPDSAEGSGLRLRLSSAVRHVSAAIRVHPSSQRAARAKPTDETAILKVLQGVYDAWDANDADVFVAEYTEDATAILPGVYRHSREEIRASMEAAYSGPLKGSTTTNEVLNVRFLADDIATVVTETGMLFPGEIDAPSDKLVNATWTLRRHNGNWLIAAYQNTPAVANMG